MNFKNIEKPFENFNKKYKDYENKCLDKKVKFNKTFTTLNPKVK